MSNTLKLLNFPAIVIIIVNKVRIKQHSLKVVGALYNTETKHAAQLTQSINQSINRGSTLSKNG